ncbi:MAG TPA: penicillin acylase family protein [Solirubrobacterales bacterium]|nr:penicillin acylase family protein [Solirubrobacterales bacterium]
MQSRVFRRVALPLVLVALTFAALAQTVSAATPQPYGTNDAGGFRNVLPPGENGLDTLGQLFAFRGLGALPSHFADQQPLYENLVYGAPELTEAAIPNYYKDATFGVPAGGIESTIEPKPGVTIVRDKAFGVPHIYGDTRAATMFGAGYAGAADRLFLMDVLRHTGRAELASFLGGANAESDAGQWAFAPYTEADLEKQLRQTPQLYGAAGQQAVEDVNAYVEGINAYITAANLDPKLAPAEYGLLKKPMEPWKPTDVIAIASLVGGIFGRGGGNELNSALTMQAFVERMGKKAGRKAWLGFRSKNDPEAPTTISKPFPYETRSAFAKKGLALPDKNSVRETASAKASSATSGGSGIAGVGARLQAALEAAGHASNWELVSARHSANGHPIAVMGPQVGYFVPQVLMEEDIHGPGIDARGAAFAGVNLYVELGHGRDYAWSATTATSDNVDTFAEVLCGKGKFHYLYRGKCLAMEKLEKSESWAPNTIDSTAAGSQTLVAYRTVHGIVFARGKVNGKKVAFVHQRSTYFHEADSVIGFAQLNEPGVVTGVKGFKKAVSNINFLFNWSYVDSEHIAYALSGAMPQRARGTSPDFPILGTGQYDWKGFKPSTQTADYLPFSKHPQAVDPPYLVSWNNKQAPEWAAADDKYDYGPIFRSQMIADKVKAATKGNKKMTIVQLIQAMEEPATQDLRGYRLLPIVFRAIGKPDSPKLQQALAMLRTWHRHGAHRRDLNRDGIDEETPAIELMDAWWPKLLEAEFKPALGAKAYERLEGMVQTGSVVGGSPKAPDYDDGWYSYVSKDLRDLVGPKPRGAWSRVYCGGGSKAKCQKVLQKSLAAALKVTPQQLYGGGNGDCAINPQPSCYDQNRPQLTSGIELKPFPFQNRPTFQQVVTLTQRLGR